DESLTPLDALRVSVLQVLVARLDVRDAEQRGDALELVARTEWRRAPALAREDPSELRHVTLAAERGQSLGPSRRLFPACRGGLLEIVRIGIVIVYDSPGVVQPIGKDILIVEHEMENRPRDACGDSRRDGEILTALRWVDARPSSRGRTDEKTRLSGPSNVAERL